MSGPGAGDHPVDGTSLQRMIDTVQRGLGRDDDVAGEGQLGGFVEFDDHGARVLTQIDIDERNGDDTAAFSDRGCAPTRRCRVMHEFDPRGTLEQLLEVPGERVPFVAVVVDHENHEPITHSRPTALQIGGITNTTSTSPTPPTMSPEMAMSFDLMAPDA